MPRHICDPDCWAVIVEHGFDPEDSDCDEDAARIAADLELAFWAAR